MSKITVAFYTIKVKERGRKGAYLPLDKLPNFKGSFLKVLEQFFMAVPEYKFVTDSKGKKYLPKASPIYRENIKPVGESFSGLIRSIQQAQNGGIVNIKTSELIAETTADDAGLMPFYFLVDCPKGGTTAIIAHQSNGIYGICSKIHPDLRMHLTALLQDEDLVVKLSGVGVGEITIKKYQDKAHIKSITGSRRKRSGDGADYDGSVDLKYKYSFGGAKRGDFIGALKDIIPKGKQLSPDEIKQKITELYQIPIDEKDDIKIILNLDGDDKVLDTTRLDRFCSFFDITSDVVISPNSVHPEFNSIDDCVRGLLNKHIRKKV